MHDTYSLHEVEVRRILTVTATLRLHLVVSLDVLKKYDIQDLSHDAKLLVGVL